MIKDSKLIGTKIKEPFGWQKFKVGELFDVIIPSDSPSDLVDVQDKYHSIPLIKAQTSNHGISGYSSGEGCYIFHSGLTIGMRGSFNVYVHINDVILGNNVAGLALKYNYSACDEYSLVYISSAISKLYAQASGYIGYPTMHKLMYDDIIELPVTADARPDFEWMSDYIKAIKANYLEQKALSNRNEIEAYLSAGNVDSTDVTDDDRQFLRDFAKLPRRKFKVGELFDFKSSMSLDKSDLTFVSKNNSFAIPYITRTVSNNGINGYVDSRLVDNEYINAGNEFSFGLLGLTAFYQCNNYCTGQFVKRFVPKFKLTEPLAMFFKTLLDRQVDVFKTVSIRSYSQLIDNTLEIELPVIDSSQVDVQSIEKYMQIQSKPLINEVAETLAPVGGGQS